MKVQKHKKIKTYFIWWINFMTDVGTKTIETDRLILKSLPFPMSRECMMDGHRMRM
jgi:hypothetical protein